MSAAQLAIKFNGTRANKVRLVWIVIAVLGDGSSPGNCGHDHATQDDATRCDWAPEGWDDMPICDLLVRQVRDRRIDPVRTRRSKAA